MYFAFNVHDDKFIAATDALKVKLEEAAKIGVVEAGHLVERFYKTLYRQGSKDMWTSSRTGKSYYVGGDAVAGFLSARSGNDRNSIRVEGPLGGDGAYTSVTGPTMVYSRAINMGNPSNMAPDWCWPYKQTKHPAPIPARPQLEHALEAALPELPGVFDGLIRAALGL